MIEINMRSMAAVNDSTAHLGSLVAGLGIGQTFRYVAQPHIDDGSLVPVLTFWSRPPMPLYVMYPPNRHLNAQVRVFVDWVAALFAKVTRDWCREVRTLWLARDGQPS